MWCQICNQDVPTIPSEHDHSTMSCLRCGEPVDRGPDGQCPATAPATGSVAEDSPAEIFRSLSASDGPDRLLRVDQVRSEFGVRPARRRRQRRSTFLCWLSLTTGVAFFVCGASLMGWSFVEGRHALWDVGTPLALAGQAVFLIGLILQLDVIWHHSRETTRTLEQLDTRLTRLHRQERESIPLTSENGRRFYQHLSEGASPQLLLADLKGQLDILASRIDAPERRPGI